MTVAFIHIAKTAGTSYTAFLADALPGEHWIPDIGGAVTIEEFHREAASTDLRRYSLVAGHFDYGLCRRAGFLRPVTVLRDPVDRLVSWYHHVVNAGVPGDAAWRELIRGRGLSVVEFLMLPPVQRVHGHAMTGVLGGWATSGDPPPTADEELLEEAQQNVAGLAHLALYERLDESVSLAAAELDLPAAPSLPGLNLSPPREDELTAGDRAVLEERLGLDVALYRFAVQEFESRLAAHGVASVGPGDDRLAPRATSGRERASAPRPVRRSSGRGRTSRAGVGDWIELAWEPPAGTPLGTSIARQPMVAALPLDEVVDQSGSTFEPDPRDELGAGQNWVRVPRGVYRIQATVPCRREASEAGEPWTVLFDFRWCGEPPVPYWGVPGAADVAVWRWQAVLPDLPPTPSRGVPVTDGALLRVPEDGGHLCFLMGSSHGVHSSPGDRVNLLYVRVG